MASDLILVAVGDLHINHPDPFSLLQHTAAVLQQADFTIGNLEGAASDVGEPLSEKEFFQSVTEKAPAHSAPALKRAGFDALGLANNHALDFGIEALLDTITTLDKLGIAHAGGGRTLAEARKPAILEKNGVRIALLACTSVFTPSFPALDNRPGVVCVDVQTHYLVPQSLPYAPGAWPRSVTSVVPKDKAMVLEDVGKAKEDADIVVVNCHWGLSPSAVSKAMGIPKEQAPNVVMDYQEELGRAIIDAGASLVVGHHPHKLQGIECYKGGLICYSVSDFAFYPPVGDPTSCMVKAYIDPQRKLINRFGVVPIRMTGNANAPQIASGKDAQAITEQLTLLSRKYGTRFSAAGDEVTVTAS